MILIPNGTPKCTRMFIYSSTITTVLRGCAGMAYYPYISPGTREAVDKGQDPIHLEHRQLDTPHVLIGPLIEDDSEHDLAPLFKVCYINCRSESYHSFMKVFLLGHKEIKTELIRYMHLALWVQPS